MIVNIAFNTIIYIMVFLFPGIIFRRTFFSGKFRNNFDSGSNFERLLWSILISVLCIVTFCFIFIMLEGLTHHLFSGLIKITEKEVLCVFEDIYSNRYPDVFRSKEKLLSCFSVFFFLYIYSAFLGFILNKFIFILKLEKSVSLLQFENQWDYLAVSNKVTNSSHKFGDRCITQIDVKTKNDELFTCKFHQFLLDKDGKVESIVVKDTFKYITLDKKDDVDKINHIKEETAKPHSLLIEHLETDFKYIYKKRIKGNIFIFSNDNIENISITYITLSNAFGKIQDIGRIAASIILVLTILFSATYAIWDFGLFDFKSNFKRIAFSFTFIVNILFLILFIASLKKDNSENFDIKEYKNQIKDSLLLFTYSLVPYLYITGIIKFSWTIILLIILLFPISFMLSKTNTNNS